MFTFLTEEYKKDAVKEYRFRLTLVYLTLATLFFILEIGLSLPTFTIIEARKKSAELEQQTLINTSKNDPSTIQNEVASISQKISLITETTHTTLLTSLFERILAQKGNSIAIHNISLKRGNSSGAITVGGIATTRDALVSFSKRLEGEPSFSNIVLPISSLAKNKNIPFTITIDATF